MFFCVVERRRAQACFKMTNICTPASQLSTREKQQQVQKAIIRLVSLIVLLPLLMYNPWFLVLPSLTMDELIRSLHRICAQ